MRLAPRLAAPALVLILAAAGCGGAGVAYNEVPGDPVQLTVPGTAEALAPAATATPTATVTAASASTAAATPTPAATTTDTTGQTSTDTTAQDGTSAAGTDDGATNDQPPPAGSPADEFENYCASNPGAC
jgi:hypothetical protein